MGRHILAALLGGMLVLGVSSAFAEELQVSEQDLVQTQLNAQLKAQKQLHQLFDATTPEGETRKPQMLTDEELDQVNAAGYFNHHRIAKRIAFWALRWWWNNHGW